MRNRWTLHLLLLGLLTFGVGLLFVQEPGFGDDLTYWTFAYDLHEKGLRAWSSQSFHDLRWPVWGVCWLLQGIGFQGITAYAGEAIVYLVAGSVIAFTFGRFITNSLPFSWAAALAFQLCPLLDTLCHRPMPDLSEGVWGGATLLAWWGLAHAETRRASLGWMALVGLGVYLTESNRLTGVFIVPVLLVATLLYARRRFFWLVGAGVVAALLYVGEAAFYHHLFHDWLHNLHANLNGKGNKGTGNIPFLTSPFRFLDSLWKVGRLSPFYSIFAAFGLGSLAADRWPRRPAGPSGGPVPAGPLVALWFIVLYLEYACSPQSLHPWQPVIRDASRFLAGLAIPFSILAVLGLRFLLELPWLRARRSGRWVPEHPVLVGAVALAALLAGTSRSFFNLGFLRDMGAYVRRVPAGTKVFTHHMMRSLAIMSDPAAAQRIVWSEANDMLDRTPALELAAAAADEFWYMRKIVWMNNRKDMERKKIRTQPPFGSYFENPDEHWALAELLVKGDSPDLTFYRRRTPAMPVPVPLTDESPELGGLLPALPVTWTAGAQRSIHLAWTIPAALRGKVIRLDTVAFANEVEAAVVICKFDPPGAAKREILLKPYTFATAGRDFFLVPIPPEAQRCAIQIRHAKATKAATLSDLKASVVTPLDGPVGWGTAKEDGKDE